jgi:hypothetical protein
MNSDAYSSTLVGGRLFRQPLRSLQDSGGFTPGLGVFIKPDAALTSIYTALDGALTWTLGSSSTQGNRLNLNVNEAVTSELQNLPMIEALLR